MKTKNVKIRLKYLYYFFKDKYLYFFHKRPNILNCEDTIKKIIDEKYSISRFGDGELFLMLKIVEFEFQRGDTYLSERLKEVLRSNEENLLIGIPNVFSNKQLGKRSKESKKWWKHNLIYYRKFWYEYLNFEQIYGDSTFTRNYMGVKDKSNSKAYFKLIKQLWNEKKVIIVEGEYSRLGVNNDLFDNVENIERIICPSKNAFDVYSDILNEVKQQSKDKLILIALGPTATVLAYDLSQLGYQAIDIGHIDIEYEWFIRNTDKKIPIKNKNVFEASSLLEGEKFYSEEYNDEIIKILL